MVKKNILKESSASYGFDPIKMNADVDKAISLIRYKNKEFSFAYNKVLHYFFAFPLKAISLSDLAKEAGISKTNANKAVLRLEEEGFIIKEVLGKLWRISCVQNHAFFTTLKIAYNLELVFMSSILLKIYEKYKNFKSVVLFGSYRKGDDTQDSDIDIAVEFYGDKAVTIKPLGIIDSFGFRKNVVVNVLEYSRNNIDSNLFANIANGIVLEGFLEVNK